MKLRSGITGAAAICLAAVLWGLDGVVLTPRLYNLDVGFVVFIVHLIPFILMHSVLYREYKRIPSFTGSDWLLFILIAGTGGALGTLAIVRALFLVNFAQLSVVILLQKLQPVFAILLAAVYLKERIQRDFILWAGVAIIAGYFLTFGWSLPNLDTGSKTPIAAMWSLVAAAAFGSATVLGRKATTKFAFQTITFYRFGFTTLIMLMYVVAFGKFDQFSQTTQLNWIIFLIIAFTTGSGAIFLYYFGLKRIKASIATICELCFPLSAIIFDFLINNSYLAPVQMISAAVLIFAILKISFVR